MKKYIKDKDYKKIAAQLADAIQEIADGPVYEDGMPLKAWEVGAALNEARQIARDALAYYEDR